MGEVFISSPFQGKSSLVGHEATGSCIVHKSVGCPALQKCSVTDRPSSTGGSSPHHYYLISHHRQTGHSGGARGVGGGAGTAT